MDKVKKKPVKLWVKYKTKFEKFEVNTPLRISHFMAQTDHESQNFKRLLENLKYSVIRLLAVFPHYFNTINVPKYANNPEAIASRIYSNRMGNGNELSGDGFKFCGRGFIMTTGKNNYSLLSKETGIDFVSNPELLEEEANAVISALWFWKKNNLNKYADLDNCDGVSDCINLGHHTPKIGDAIGYKERKELTEKYKKELSC